MLSGNSNDLTFCSEVKVKSELSGLRPATAMFLFFGTQTESSAGDSVHRIDEGAHDENTKSQGRRVLCVVRFSFY